MLLRKFIRRFLLLLTIGSVSFIIDYQFYRVGERKKLEEFKNNSEDLLDSARSFKEDFLSERPLPKQLFAEPTIGGAEGRFYHGEDIIYYKREGLKIKSRTRDMPGWYQDLKFKTSGNNVRTPFTPSDLNKWAVLKDNWFNNLKDFSSDSLVLSFLFNRINNPRQSEVGFLIENSQVKPILRDSVWVLTKSKTEDNDSSAMDNLSYRKPSILTFNFKADSVFWGKNEYSINLEKYKNNAIWVDINEFELPEIGSKVESLPDKLRQPGIWEFSESERNEIANLNENPNVVYVSKERLDEFLDDYRKIAEAYSKLNAPGNTKTKASVKDWAVHRRDILFIAFLVIVIVAGLSIVLQDSSKRVVILGGGQTEKKPKKDEESTSMKEKSNTEENNLEKAPSEMEETHSKEGADERLVRLKSQIKELEVIIGGENSHQLQRIWETIQELESNQNFTSGQITVKKETEAEEKSLSEKIGSPLLERAGSILGIKDQVNKDTSLKTLAEEFVEELNISGRKKTGTSPYDIISKYKEKGLINKKLRITPSDHWENAKGKEPQMLSFLDSLAEQNDLLEVELKSVKKKVGFFDEFDNPKKDISEVLENYRKNSIGGRTGDITLEDHWKNRCGAKDAVRFIKMSADYLGAKELHYVYNEITLLEKLRGIKEPDILIHELRENGLLKSGNLITPFDYWKSLEDHKEPLDKLMAFGEAIDIEEYKADLMTVEVAARFLDELAQSGNKGVELIQNYRKKGVVVSRDKVRFLVSDYWKSTTGISTFLNTVGKVLNNERFNKEKEDLLGAKEKQKKFDSSVSRLKEYFSQEPKIEGIQYSAYRKHVFFANTLLEHLPKELRVKYTAKNSIDKMCTSAIAAYCFRRNYHYGEYLTKGEIKDLDRAISTYKIHQMNSWIAQNSLTFFENFKREFAAGISYSGRFNLRQYAEKKSDEHRGQHIEILTQLASLSGDLYNAYAANRDIRKAPIKDDFDTPALNRLLGYPMDENSNSGRRAYSEERNSIDGLRKSIPPNIVQAYIFLAVQSPRFRVERLNGLMIGRYFTPKEVIQYEYDQMVEAGLLPNPK